MPTTSLAQEIRDYLKIADVWLRRGVEDGSLPIEEAKKHAAEIDKWAQYLARLEEQAA